MAEDDDDETFGDFAFASFQSNSQSHGPNSFASDDEWGDFLKSPQQSKLSDSSFQGSNPSDNSVSLSRWMKPSGALPLSIFGVAEEEGNGSFAVSGDFNKGKSDVINGDFDSTSADNRISNSQNLSIADLYNQYSQIKPENRPGSNSIARVDSVENGAVIEVRKMDLSDAVSMSDHGQLGNKSDNDEFSFKSHVPDSRENGDLFGSWCPEFTGFSSILNSNSPIVQTISSGLDMNGPKQEMVGSAADDDDDGDDGWEFKDAFSERQSEEVNNNVDLMAHEISERSAYSSGTGSGSNKSVDLFGTSNGSIDFFAMSTGTVGRFATSGGISSTSPEVDLIGVQSSITVNGFTSHTNSITEQNNIKSLLNDSTDVLIEEFDKDFEEFTAAFSETVSNPAEASSEDVLSPSRDATSTTDGKIQEKDMKSNFQKGAIPLSIFGNEEPESDGSLDVLDVFMPQPTFDQRNTHTPTTATSINDLISSLYSQAEQTSSTDTVKQPTQIQFSPPNAVSNSNLVTDDDDHLDDSSWDFMGASQTRDDSEASLCSIGDTCLSRSSRLKPNNYLDFYSILKEELCFVAKCHVERLKQAQVNASLSGEDARADSLVREFQLVCKELEQMSFVLEESKFQDRPSGDTYLNEFVEVLLEPQFQKLESEFHLSQKLLHVEKDLGSAVELIRHTTTMLKILTIGTLDNQMTYVSIWSEMISVCAQELKHGALIWNQAVEKHIQSQLLTESQGKEFVLALGEIYRVIVVLEASAKLFKPWTLSASSDSATICTLLEECHTVWSTAGLEEALSSASAATASDGRSLCKSIKQIRDLDALTLQNCVFKEKESRCCLSILTAGVVPGMKMIMWENEQCFVTLANLWANLISRNPPKLPQLNLG